MKKFILAIAFFAEILHAQTQVIPATSGSGGGTEATAAEAQTATGSTQMMTPRRTNDFDRRCSAYITSSTVLTIGSGASSTVPCNYAFDLIGNFAITSAKTATITAGSGNGSFVVYVTTGGTITVEYSNGASLTVSGSGLTASGVATPTLPVGAIHLASGTITSGTWAAITPLEAKYSASGASAGTGISVSSGAIAIDSTVPQKGASNAWTGGNDWSAGTSFIVRTGTGAPSSGECDASGEKGNLYVQTGDPGSVATRVSVCTQTAASTWAWNPISHKVGTTAPTTCVTGEVFFDSDATAGSNWFGCTAANTWTALGSSVKTRSLPIGIYGIDLPTSAAAFGGVMGTSPHRITYYGFGTGSDTSLQWNIRLPTDLDCAATMTAKIALTGTGGSGNFAIRLNTYFAGTTSGDLLAPTYNSNQDGTIADPGNGVPQLYSVALTSTGCAAGGLLSLRMTRLDTSGSDTSGSNLLMYGLVLDYSVQ